MRNPLLLLTVGLVIIWLARFVLGLMRGRVKGAHPIEKRFTWIEKAEHPKHFWMFTLLQCILFVVVVLLILGLSNNPAY